MADVQSDTQAARLVANHSLREYHGEHQIFTHRRNLHSASRPRPKPGVKKSSPTSPAQCADFVRVAQLFLRRCVTLDMQPNYPSLESGAYDPEGEGVMCPECRSDMYLLATYELPGVSEFPAVEFDFWDFILWGWTITVGNFIYGLITYNGRKAKLAALKRGVLPRYPHSLVCPRCLSVARRV